MQLARVVGTVVASHKEPELEGLTMLLLQNANPQGEGHGGFVVAADAVGAGVGELVLYASGSSARLTQVTRDRPIDSTIMAIVDNVGANETEYYSKCND